MKVKFLKAGKWAGNTPQEPSRQIAVGEVHDLNDKLARMALNAGHAVVAEDVPEATPEPEPVADEESSFDDLVEQDQRRKGFSRGKRGTGRKAKSEILD